MFKLLRGDVYKLGHSFGFRVMAFLSFVFGFIGFVSLAYAGTMDPLEINLGGIDAYYTHFDDFRTLMFVFVGVFSGLFIGEDFACRTFQGEVGAGNSRSKVLLSKTLIFILGICSMIVIQKLIIFIGASIVNGFGVEITGFVIENMLRAGLMFMLQVSACSMICVLTCVLLKNKASIIATNFLILILIDAILQMISTMSDKALLFYMKTPLVLSLTSSTPSISQYEIGISIIIGLSTLIGIYLVSNFHFRRCELK